MSDTDRTPSPSTSLPASDIRTRKNVAHHDQEVELEPLHASQDDPLPKARYHKSAMLLLILYVPLVVLPWILTCLMAKRPIGASSYYNQHGLSDSDLNRIEEWVLAVDVLNSIGSLITIPVLSALIAQAVAVYSHKHELNANYRLEYLIAFADRGWTNPLTLRKSWKWPGRGSNGARNVLLFAALTIIIVPTCHDTGYMKYLINKRRLPPCARTLLPPKVVGWDMEPTQMGSTYQDDIFQEILNELAIASLIDEKPHLWNVTANPNANKLRLRDLSGASFVATLEQGTSTGTLRQHIMRFNSSVTCQKIQRSAFPSPCPGEQPFTRTFSHSSNITRICVPGNLATSPWTMSRSRQDIVEDLFLDIIEVAELGNPRYVGFRNLTSNYTLQCTASTTRGYFELGNYRNNYTWGPLLDVWPSPGDIASQYNDYIDFSNKSQSIITSRGRFPMEFADPPWPTNKQYYRYVPGPLTMATIALFGNNTFFDMAVQAWNISHGEDDSKALSGERLCNLVPFARLDPISHNDLEPISDRNFPGCETRTGAYFEDLAAREFLSKWLHGFNNTNATNTAMSTAVFLVNQAVVTMDQWLPRFSSGGTTRESYGRTIYSGFGTTVRKPQLSIAVIAVMSCILVLELLCLATLAWLIYRGPSETRTLDVMAFSRLKERMEEHKGLLT